MEVLNWAHKDLQSKKIPKARLDAEVLLGHALGLERLQLYTNFDRPLTQSERANFRNFIKQRRDRVPVAYILGNKEFYSRSFTVNSDVLIPRPESELIIEEVLAFYKNHTQTEQTDFSIIDVGTGSGCLAVTLALEIPNAEVTATDISEKALDIARKNSVNLNGNVNFLCSYLLNKIGKETKFNCIVSNPPYIETKVIDTLSKDVQTEPKLALDGGEDGLVLIRKLITQSIPKLKPMGLLIIEIGHDQGEKLLKLMSENKTLTNLKIIKDLSGHSRVATAICSQNCSHNS